MLEDFAKPEFIHALTTATVYGGKVVIAMMVVSALLVLCGGGLSARNWPRDESPSPSH